MADRAKFFFQITYFKPSGKYYTQTVVEWELRRAGPELAYLQDAISKLRGFRDNGGQDGLPGLSTGSEGWDGPILIQQVKLARDADALDDYIPDGVPHMIMPRTDDEKPGRAYERI